MTQNRPSGQNSPKGTPPTRRTARQQRLAQRDSGRAISRVSTSGGSDRKPMLLVTGLFVLVAAVVIGVAIYSSQSKTSSTDAPIAPHFVTPANIAWSGRTLGDPNAKVTLEVWSDFRCTGCFSFISTIEPKIVDTYVATGKVKLVYKDFLTIDSNQPGVHESRDAANAGFCAADQGKFWLLHDWLFSNQSASESKGAFTLDRLVEIGKAAGLDMTSYEPCVRNGTHNADVAAQVVPAGAGFTPYTYVDGKAVVGPKDSTGADTAATYELLAAAIDTELGGGAGASASPSVSPAAS